MQAVLLLISYQHLKILLMKKINLTLLSAIFLAVLAFSSSCKKTSDPGPAGANGTNGINGKDGALFAYKQPGTTLNLKGMFYSDDASFDNLLALPFFNTLDENYIKTYYPALRTEGTVRTSVNGKNTTFYITRYDSLGNSSLSFQITDDYQDLVSLNYLHFNVKTNITNTSYRKVYTTDGGGGVARVSGPYNNETSLDGYTLDNYGNSFSITNWSYNPTTQSLSFDYNGTLVGGYNSTGNDLAISGTVKANLKEETLRKGN